MGYVDLRRRAERRRDLREPPEPRRYTGRNPYLLVTLGFLLGILASILASSIFYIGFGGPDPFATLLLVIAGLTVLGYAGWRLVRRGQENEGPRFGAEKQLLLAILDAGGSVTPVEAALATSLTVDEAEQILTRLTDRGHLLVESRNGVLSYALPGGQAVGPGGLQ